jgi:hypothetical protein
VNENSDTIEPVGSGSKESDDNGVSSTTNDLSLTVKPPFHYSSGSQGKGGMTRVYNAPKRSYKTISTLKDEKVNLWKKIKTIQNVSAELRLREQTHKHLEEKQTLL